MNWSNVQDMPIPHYHNVRDDEVEDILKYNLNDVMSTYAFYIKSKEQMQMRIALSKEYKLSLINANDPKIGSEIFAKLLSIDMEIPIDQLKQMRTPREIINLNDCILPYVEFKSSSFKALLIFLKSQNISETKGFFTNIPINNCKTIIDYVNPNTIKPNGKLESLNIRYHNVDFFFGTGGLHSACESGIYKSDNDYIIKSADVKSYYPNLSINNDFRPEHLGISFTKIYKGIYDKRVTTPKGSALNTAFKLMLNGSYGKSNDEHSFLYDPLFTMCITINGQLLLTMLIEEITLNIPDCKILMVNTDGFECRFHKKYINIYNNICDKWQQLTKLELEFVDYKLLIIRDVNSYISVSENDKIKSKGTFEINKDWHKDHSMKIVPKALEAYYVYGIPVEETIMKSTDIYDFTLSMKVTRGWTAINRRLINGEYIEDKLQKNNRYLITNRGGTLMKIHADGREFNVEKSFNVTVFNQYYACEEFSCYDINYNYYIREAYKIINVISNNNQLNLF